MSKTMVVVRHVAKNGRHIRRICEKKLNSKMNENELYQMVRQKNRTFKDFK